MKIKKTVVTTLVLCGLVVGCSEEKIDEKNNSQMDIWSAMDARDAENPAFEDALLAENWLALEMLGQVGGAGCEKLVPYIGSENTMARIAAQTGAAYCYGEAVTPALLAQLDVADEQFEKSKILTALSFSGDPAVTPVLIESFDPENVASVYALMQKITYDRMEATALTSISFDAVLAETSNSETGFANAYFLVRLQGIDQIYTMDAVVEAVGAARDPAVKKLLVRLLPQFGDAVSSALLALAKSEVGPAKIEAVRSLGRLSDPTSKAYLASALNQPDGPLRQLAITALARRDVEDTQITEVIAGAIASTDEAVASVALESLMQRSPAEGLKQAKVALWSSSYYLANKAMGQLAGVEEGRSILAQYVAENSGTKRADDIRLILDPEAGGGGAARPTPSADIRASYQDAKLKLHTTRGEITITMLNEAAFAATSFLQLAESGKMDGMLWHRVIPNFVAQAGQIEDMSISDWGTIREEWFAADHVIGTVGLATVGKDTGSTQFFINTAYNLHLNGRYTVFGEVTEGLDVAMALREGDIITKGNCRC